MAPGGRVVVSVGPFTRAYASESAREGVAKWCPGVGRSYSSQSYWIRTASAQENVADLCPDVVRPRSSRSHRGTRIVSYRIDPAGLAENRARPSRRPVRHRHDDAVRESTRVALSDSHLCDGRATKRTGREGFEPRSLRGAPLSDSNPTGGPAAPVGRRNTGREGFEPPTVRLKAGRSP